MATTATTPITPPSQETLSAQAKEQFLKAYQGATIQISTTFHHRLTIRAYKRTFAIAVRNWHLATSLARTKLDDGGAATKVQEGMLRKVDSSLAFLDKQIKMLDAMVQSEGGIDLDSITHGNVYTDKVVMLGPVSMKFRQVFLSSDKVLDIATALYTYGVLPEAEFQNISFEIKKLLYGIDKSIRNFRKGVLERVNAEGGARPGYKGAVGKGKPSDAGAEAGGDAVGAAAAAAEVSAAAPEAKVAGG